MEGHVRRIVVLIMALRIQNQAWGTYLLSQPLNEGYLGWLFNEHGYYLNPHLDRERWNEAKAVAVGYAEALELSWYEHTTPSHAYIG